MHDRVDIVESRRVKARVIVDTKLVNFVAAIAVCVRAITAVRPWRIEGFTGFTVRYNIRTVKRNMLVAIGPLVLMV